MSTLKFTRMPRRRGASPPFSAVSIDVSSEVSLRSARSFSAMMPGKRWESTRGQKD